MGARVEDSLVLQLLDRFTNSFASTLTCCPNELHHVLRIVEVHIGSSQFLERVVPVPDLMSEKLGAALGATLLPSSDSGG